MAESKQTNVFDLTSEQLKEYQVGDVLSASRLNRPIRAINRLLGNVPRGQQVIRTTAVPAKGTVGAEVRRFVVSGIVTFNGSIPCVRAESENEDEIDVAIPSLFRARIYVANPRNEIEYQRGGPQIRIARRQGIMEVQAIIPTYMLSDIIYAAKIPGGADVHEGFGANARDVLWQDLNVDGRVWAKTQ